MRRDSLDSTPPRATQLQRVSEAKLNAFAGREVVKNVEYVEVQDNTRRLTWVASVESRLLKHQAQFRFAAPVGMDSQSLVTNVVSTRATDTAAAVLEISVQFEVQGSCRAALPPCHLRISVWLL